MSSSALGRAAACALLLLAGCDRSQPWRFRNGASIGDAPPPSILAEIYEGECGPCAPVGTRLYCETLEGTRAGARPDGLVDGEIYCFIGTALDEQGQAYGIGCETVQVGGGEIDITLAEIEPDRFIARRCPADVEPMDAGPPFDAGPGMDAGEVIFDAGPPGQDAGPPMDGGLRFGDPVRVRFRPVGPGAVYLTVTQTGMPLGEPQPIREPTIRNVDAYVGFAVTIDPEPDADGVYLGIGGGCGTRDPCPIQFDRSEEIVIGFAEVAP